MIVSEALQAWIADKTAQRETRARTDDFARAWNAGPIHRRFEEAMTAIAVPTAETVADAVCALFADEDWLDAMMAALVERMRADPWFDPPFRGVNSDIHAGLLVFEDEKVSISAGVTDAVQLAARKNRPRDATSIGFSGQMGVFKFVQAGGARLSFWEGPELDGNFTRRQCRHLPARRRTATSRMARSSSSTAAANPMWSSGCAAASCWSRPRSPSTRRRSASNMTARPAPSSAAAATGDTRSRIQMITTLLRKLDHQAAFPAIAAFLDHADFFVRWHVMKELLGLDAEAALPHLKRMAARDPHPEPRRAARLVLDRIETAPRAAKRQAA